MKNLVKLNRDGLTANIICDRADGTTVAVKVDIADLAKLAVHDYRWSVGQTNATNQYCMTLVRTGDKKHRIYLHRLLLDFPNQLEVDHKDGDGLNNTRENLQILDRQSNAAKMRINNKPRKGNRLGVRGVTKSPSGRYECRLQGKYVASFSTLDAAARVYDKLRTDVNIARTGRP